MKKILALSLLAAFIVSCSDPMNDKAETLIKADMKHTLVKPETYHAESTETDSAFAPIDDPRMFSVMNDIATQSIVITQIESSIAELEKLKEDAQKGMNLLANFGKRDDAYNKYKETLNRCDSEIKKLQPKLDTISGGIEKQLDVARKFVTLPKMFIGYKSKHLYTARNQQGQEMTDSCYYLFDKDMKKVVLSLPMNKYHVLMESVKALKE